MTGFDLMLRQLIEEHGVSRFESLPLRGKYALVVEYMRLQPHGYEMAAEMFLDKMDETNHRYRQVQTSLEALARGEGQGEFTIMGHILAQAMIDYIAEYAQEIMNEHWNNYQEPMTAGETL